MKLLKTLLLFLLFPLLAVAQRETVICVTDTSGAPIVYADVRLIGKDSVISVTDLLGCLRINSTDGASVLVISTPDHQTKRVPLVGHSSFAVSLEPKLKPQKPINQSPVGYDSVVLEDVAYAEVMDVAMSPPAPSLPPPPPPPPPVDMEVSAAYTTRSVSSEIAAPAKVSAIAETYSTEPAPETDGLPKRERPAAGQLTAGEINDFSKWELWNDIRDEDLSEFRQVWQLFPDNRYAVQLLHPGGSAATNVTVKLMTQRGRVLWMSKTDNLGRAELWRGMIALDKAEQERLQILAEIPGQSLRLPTAQPISKGLNVFELPVSCDRATSVDVAFVVDATGSMGDEIDYLSSELLDVMSRAGDSLSGQELRMASVFYRDQGDEYLTRVSNFSEDHQKTVDFVKSQYANGGGDTPEAVDAALTAAVEELDWDDNAAARILFLVLDAPPHSDSSSVRKMQSLTARLATRGIRVVPVVCSGMDKSGEYLMRSLALATNGTYTFLTDHSGIGNAHLEPSTDAYDVEKLNDLLVRIIHQFGKTAECTPTAELALPSRIPLEHPVGEWSLFPNPTFGPTNVQLSAAEGELFLIDTNGKILKRFVVNGQNMRVDLSDLPSATYYFRYHHGEEVSVKRIVVNRA